MAFSGMLRLVALVRTDVSDVLSASIIRVTRIGELGTILAVASNRSTLHSHRRGNLKSYNKPSNGEYLMSMIREVCGFSGT
jgi:hypothetical protein